MDSSEHVRTAERRQEETRRLHTRSGRRETDSTHRVRCPWCTSPNIELLDTIYEVYEYGCRSCSETWLSIP